MDASSASESLDRHGQASRWRLLAWTGIGGYTGWQIGGSVAHFTMAANTGTVLHGAGMVVGGMLGVWNARKNVGAGRWELGLAALAALAGFIGSIFAVQLSRSLPQALGTLAAGVLNGCAGGAIAGSIVAALQRQEKDAEE